MTTTPNAETLRRVDTSETFIRWIFPHLSGDDGDKETAFLMILAQMNEKYLQGILDAGTIANDVAQARPLSREAAAISQALAELAAKTQSDIRADTGLDTTKPAQR